MSIPAPKASRPAVGIRAKSAAKAPPFDGAHVIALPELGTAVEIAEALPDPTALAKGTLVVLPAEIAGERTLAQSVLAVFGRKKTNARRLRCSALVLRGYVDVGAADDVVWGSATGPC